MKSTAKMMQRHPLSSAFPNMETKDFEELIADIAANGLIQPVVTLDGMILDGWHRYRACLEAGAEPSFEVFRGDDPVAFVLSLNMHRRHLTGSQRAAAVVSCSTWARPGNQPKPEATSGLKTESEMAEAAGVSDRTIRQAKRAQEAGLGEAVRDGKLTAERAAAVAKMPEPERKAAIEAPQPKPEPKVKTSDDTEALKARIAELEAENEDLKDKIAEVSRLMADTQEELDAARRTLDAENLLAQFDKEVKRAQEQARVVQARNNGLMNENADLKGMLKSARRKVEKLEKASVQVAS